MDTNEQVHQPDGTPPLSSCFSEAGEQQVKKVGGPNDQALATNPPQVSLTQSAAPTALANVPPKALAYHVRQLDAGQTKKAFEDLSDVICSKSEEFACAFKSAAETWDELTPYLSQMQSLLSQRGEQRQAVLRQAGLPTWMEWFEAFKKDLGLKISLRAVQKRLAKLREKSLGGNDGKPKGHRHVVKTDREKASYQHGYQAAKSELQAQLKAAAEKESALAGRIAGLERENERLQGIARQLQEQRQEGGDKAVVKLPQQVERLKEFAKLAVEAFEIIHGQYGERLMGNPEGKRLVEIAKKAAAMKGKVKVL